MVGGQLLKEMVRTEKGAIDEKFLQKSSGEVRGRSLHRTIASCDFV